MEIIWKEIPGYEGKYMVSEFGDVKSFHSGEWLLLNPSTASGYCVVNLSGQDGIKMISVHKIVAIMFLGHDPDKTGLEIDHFDDNKLNNHYSNLRIVTRRQNMSKNRKGTSSYTGVHFDKKSEYFCASIWINRKGYHIGRFKEELSASKAYNEVLEILNHHGNEYAIKYIKQKKLEKRKGRHIFDTKHIS